MNSCERPRENIFSFCIVLFSCIALVILSNRSEMRCFLWFGLIERGEDV